MSESLRATFERPVKAKLVVVTEHGEQWDATADDLKTHQGQQREDHQGPPPGRLVVAYVRIGG